jgi:large subunit ribosomal protein LP0
MPLSAEKKAAYFVKLEECLNTYTKLFMVTLDNVGSRQMAQIRKELRGKAVVLMGKNTMMRRGFKLFIAANPGHPMEALLPHIVGNTGFVFTNGDMAEVRSIIIENVVPAPARIGVEAPCEVRVPPGPTGCDPGQTSFFQALNIATKISRGQIEIISEVKLLEVGEKVTPGHSAFLKKMNILPFSYGVKIKLVYDNGSVFDPVVLDLSDDDVANKFCSSARILAALGLAISYPTLASLRFSMAGAFAKVLALSLETKVACKETQIFIDYLEDPSKFAGMIGGGGGGGGAAAAAPAEEEEVEEEVDVSAGGLFGGDDDGGDY